MAIRILIAGVAGKMGRALVREALSTPAVALAGGFERPGHAAVGKDIGPLAGFDSLGLRVEEDAAALIRRSDTLVDFTAPSASLANARLCADAGVPLILGTTGFSASEESAIRALAGRTAIVKSGNMSLGVNLLAELVRDAAARLGPDYDIEIVEAHHRAKTDAPSGTALMLGAAAAQGRGETEMRLAPRDGVSGERPRGGVGYAVIRGGGIVGDHSVLFAGAQEVLTLSHRAIDRGLFAKGAVAAAIWATGKPPGLYSMADVLGFTRPH